MRNLFQEYIVSNELISHLEDDPFGLELEKIQEKIIDYTKKNIVGIDDGYQWYLNNEKGIKPYLDEMAKVIQKRLGINVTIVPHYKAFNACTLPFYIRENNVLSKLEGLPYIDEYIKLRVKVLAKMLDGKGITKGTIDLQKAKITGPLSNYINSLMIDYESLILGAELNAKELTAIILHELGHMFTYLDMAYRTDKTNQVLTHIANSIKVKEPASKREYYLVELKENGVISEKEYLELAKEERPVILTMKLFSFIYKYYVDNSISLEYSVTTAETVADNFSAKFGYAAPLVSSLSKLKAAYKKFGFMRPEYVDLSFPISIWYLFIYATLSLVSVIPGALRFIEKIMYRVGFELTKRSCMIYDTSRYRGKRIGQVLIDAIKDPSMKKNNILKSLADIKLIEKIVASELDDATPSGLICKLVLFFSSDRRTEEENLRKERILEELANNPLFISAKELEYSKEDFYRALFPYSEKEHVSTEARASNNSCCGEDRTGFDKAFNKAEGLYSRKDNVSLAIPGTANFGNTAQATIVIADKAKVTKDSITIGSKTLVNLLTGDRYMTAKSILDYSILDKAEPYFLKFIDAYLGNIAYDETGRYIEPVNYQNTIGKAIEDFCKNVIGFKEYVYGIARLGLCYSLPPSIIDSVNKNKIRLIIEGDFTKSDIERLYNALAALKPLVKKNFFYSGETERDITSAYSSRYEAKHKKYARDKWVPELLKSCKTKTKDQVSSIASEAVVYTWGFANNLCGFITHYFNMVYMALSAIEKKISKKISKEWWFSSNDNKPEPVEIPREDVTYETILDKIAAIKESNNPPISKNGYTVVHNKKCGLLLADKATIANNEIVISSSDLVHLITGPRLKALKDVLSNDPLSKFRPQIKRFIDVYAGDMFIWSPKANEELANIAINFTNAALGIKEFAYNFSCELDLNTDVNPTYTACSNTGNIRVTGNFSTSDINALYNAIVSLKASMAKYKTNTVESIFDKKMYKELESYAYTYMDKLRGRDNYNQREAYKTLEYVVISTYAFPCLMDEYVDAYISLLNLAISSIGSTAISKESVELTLGLELISPQLNDPVGKKLDDLHDEMRKMIYSIPNEAMMEKHYNDGMFDDILGKIERTIYDRFGLSIALTCYPDEDFAMCLPYYLRNNNILNTYRDLKHEVAHNEPSRKYARNNNLSSGTVDSVHVKITGSLSRFNHFVYINYYTLIRDLKSSPREITSILLHEIGHLFTFIEMGHRVDKSNLVMADVANSIKIGEPPSKREYYLVELKNMGIVDKDLIERLAKEERPLIMSMDLFTSIYKKFVDTSLSTETSDTTAEVIADDFAVKFGYGEEMARILHRVERVYGGPRPISTVTSKWIRAMSFFAYAILITEPIIKVLLSCMVFDLLTRLYDKIMIGFADTLNGRLNVDYDTMMVRLQRIRKSLISSIKGRKIPKDTKENILVSLDTIESIIKDYEDDDQPTFAEKVVSLIFPSKKFAIKNKYTEKFLEDLANNDFFVFSHKLDKTHR